MPTILISGAAYGLGAAFTEAYSKQPNVQIIALDREDCSYSLHNNVETLMVDLSDEESITALGKKIHGRPIDLVIHSAGIRGLVPEAEKERPNDVASCETLAIMDAATITRAFSVNATGTFLLLKTLLSNLRLAAAPQPPKVIVMASRMGSIGNNELPNKDAGSAYAYRASKAALNMIVRSFAVDIPEVTFVLCHPGRVESRLVKCVEEGAITAEESVKGMLPLIDSWGRNDSGRFYDRFGKTIQW